MALTLTTAARNAAADAACALVNSGTLVLKAGSTVVATFNFAASAFGAASNGVATAAAISAVNAVAAGTVDNFEAKNSSNANIFTGTVTANGGGGDLTLDNTSIANGQQVSISSLTYTQPAS